MTLERHYRQHGGKTRSADCHRSTGAVARGQPHQPIAGHPRLFRISSEVRFAQSPAVGNDPVA